MPKTGVTAGGHRKAADENANECNRDTDFIFHLSRYGYQVFIF